MMDTISFFCGMWLGIVITSPFIFYVIKLNDKEKAERDEK